MFLIIILLVLLTVIISLCLSQYKFGGTPNDGALMLYDPKYAEMQKRDETGQEIAEMPRQQFTKIKTNSSIRPLQTSGSLSKYNDSRDLVVNSFANLFNFNSQPQVSVQVVDGQLLMNVNNNLFMPEIPTQPLESAELVSGEYDVKTTSKGAVTNYKFMAEGGAYYLLDGKTKVPLKRIDIEVINRGANATFKYGDYIYNIGNVNSYFKSMSYSNFNGFEQRSNSSLITVNNDQVIVVDYNNKPQFYNLRTKKIEEAPTFKESPTQQDQ